LAPAPAQAALHGGHTGQASGRPGGQQAGHRAGGADRRSGTALCGAGRAAAAGPAPGLRPAPSVRPLSAGQDKERSAMSSGLNREIHLAARPQGWPTLDTFALVETPIPEPTEGQVLVRNVFMSVDPYMRGRMNAARSYAPPYEVGQVLYGGAVGQVLVSRTPAFAEGDIVLSNNGWREYFVSDGRGLERIAPAVPLSYYLGVLGMPGLT